MQLDAPEFRQGAAMSDYFSLTKKCPCRPPAWRWLQAAYHLDHPDERLPPPKDRWIERAMTIQLGLRAGKPREEILKIDRECRHCLRAHDLWADDVRLTKAVIESRILADETAADIARKFGMPKRTIEVFERLFFDVRPKLQHTGYVFCTVLGPEYHDWSRMPRFETVLKALAYTYGPWMLDAVLQYTTTSIRPASIAEVGQILRDIPFDEIDMRAALAVRMLPITDATRPGILTAAARVLELLAKQREEPVAAGLENASQIVLDELTPIVEADPDTYGKILPRILGIPKAVAA